MSSAPSQREEPKWPANAKTFFFILLTDLFLSSVEAIISTFHSTPKKMDLDEGTWTPRNGPANISQYCSVVTDATHAFRMGNESYLMSELGLTMQLCTCPRNRLNQFIAIIWLVNFKWVNLPLSKQRKYSKCKDVV